MFLRCSHRKKNGKDHRYWSIVENRRLGDGRVALILDVDVLVTDMRRRSSRPDFKLAS